MISYLVDRARRPAGSLPGQPSLDAPTPTERQILRLLAEYKTSQEIADQLFISPRTVRTHRKNICTKLAPKAFQICP